MPDRDKSNAYAGEALRWAALFVVPPLDSYLAGGSWYALCHIPLLLLATPAYAGASLFVTLSYALGVWLRCGGLDAESWAASLTARYPGYLVMHFTAAAIFMIAGRLWQPIVPDTRRARLVAKHGPLLRGVLLAAALALLGLMLLDHMPLWRSGGWALVLVYLRGRLPAPAPTPTPLKTRLATAALTLCSLAVSLAIVETGLRVFVPYDVCYYDHFMPHPQCLFTLRPTATSTMLFHPFETELKAIEIVVSEQGVRNRPVPPKPPGEFRILMLGDSFTLGYATRAADSYPQVLDRLFEARPIGRPVTVINAGVPGYGPWQEHIFLRERGFPLEPDLVLLQLFPANDIHNTLVRVNKHLKAFRQTEAEHMAMWRHRRQWQYRLNIWLRMNVRSYRSLQETLPWKFNIPLLWNSLRFVEHLDIPRVPLSMKRPSWIETELAAWYPELEEGLELMIQDVLAIQRDCQARGVDLRVYCVPLNASVDAAQWEGLMREYGHLARYERGKSIRLVEQALREAGLEPLPLQDALLAAGEPGRWYYPCDGHFTPDGCRFVAEFLYDYLCQHYFAP